MFSAEPTRISKSALLPYTQDQLFGLINDIEAYPDFMDGCVEAKILKQDEASLDAKLYLSKRGITQSFTTRNHLFDKNKITMELIEGPFETLRGEWNIDSLGDSSAGEQGCKLSLDLEFTMGGSLIMKMAAPFFAEMGNRLVDAVASEAAARFA